ncbi:MAG: ChaN family lipoprotein [Hyphomicrobiales bacterium]
MIYSKNGELTNFHDLLKASKNHDVILFGELHNNPISHWLQYELTNDLFLNTKGKIQLGAEMIESDNQLLLNEYLKGIITEKNFTSQARLWPNYETDYSPLINFAKANKLKFIATNVPRRYASIVNKKGFSTLDSLSTQAKEYIAPLPIPYDPNLSSYKKMQNMMGGKHNFPNLPKAQALKDATMAWNIGKNIISGNAFIHVNGSYHSDNFQGICWYLNKYYPKLKALTITTVEQDNINKLDDKNLGVADFIIVVPNTMTKTY